MRSLSGALRRKLLSGCGLAVVGLAFLALPPQAQASHTAFTQALRIPAVIDATGGGVVDLQAVEADVEVLPGAPTRMWTFNGTFPGPTIRQKSGVPITVNVRNALPPDAGPLSIHNHGNHSKPEFDGSPHEYLIQPGQTYGYQYAGTEDGGNERGATQWYHDHTDKVTGRNVWMGLAGMYILDDPAEDVLNLPKGEFDVPLMLADRSFDANNQLNYSFSPSGVTGDHVLVNGTPQPFFAVKPAKYRLRLLNASNIRDYEVALSNGAPLQQIASESGLLPAPVDRASILLGSSERVDVVVDFAQFAGQNVVLRNLDAQGAAGELMQFRVTGAQTNDAVVPAALRAAPLDLTKEPVAAKRTFVFDRKGGGWTINGKPFDPARIEARPVLGTTEEWTFHNPSGWTHVAHTHDVDQQLISRNGAPAQPWETTKEAWHIGGGQTVVVRLRFTDHTGLYMIHCHVLEHEDDGMMTQFEVVAPPSDPPPAPTTGTLALIGPSSSDPLAGDGFEGTPSAAHTDDGGAATNADGTGQSHAWSGYDVSALPDNATITGLAVRADWFVDARRGSTNRLGVALSSDGTTWTTDKTDTSSSTRERSVTFGGTADLWGRAWTKAELMSLRARVTTTSTDPARDFSLDWLPLSVTYTTP
ncbi:MAG: multicopper oxidase family protein [Actinomycetota bacterium]|nr:multicopper oxidase family protein [Actinomycetota bacterium]